ncbi:MAG: GTP 3',8-cyclase MoaA [Planctomycetota bacterium]|nr:GTP 3',8-cyclase MoaA [Planctomycetota bacterium]
MTTAGLVDGFGRRHTDLRISVTDRCNLRCTYCMPLEVQFKPREELLRFEEIARVTRVAAGLGVRTIRLTGGEPLLRRDLAELVRQLVAVPGIEEVALTTNGLLLAEQAADLRDAGLARLNVSLDSLTAAGFERLARRPGLDRVLAGLEAARSVGFPTIRLNAVSIRGLTEPDVVPLARFCRRHGFHLRFIEFMPLDAEAAWDRGQVLSGAEVRGILEREIGPLVADAGTDPGQPALDYHWSDGGRVGFINPVTRPFCDRCDRVRLTADGQLRNCLFSTVEWDVRGLLRSAVDDARIAAVIRECVAAKRAAHGIDTPAFERPERAMYQIGG